jgi:phosphatidylinositol 4-phosphatase
VCYALDFEAKYSLFSLTDYSLFYYFMLWFTLLSVALLFIIIHGIAYVSWPRLIPPTDVIYYSGPGFRSANHGKGLNGDLTAKKVGRWLRGGKAPIGIEEVEMGDMKKRVD